MRAMVIGAFYFSLMTLFVKLVGQRVPNQEIVLVRGALTLVFSYALLRRAGVHPLGNRRGLLVLRGFLGFAALSFMYYALVHLPLAEATVLQYTNPLWAALLGAIYLTEKLSWREVSYVLGSLFGVLLIARPHFLFGGASAGLDPIAVAAGLAGALCSGAAYVTVRDLSRTEHPLVIIFYFPLVTVAASLPGALANFVPPTSREWILLFGVAVAAQMGQIYITRGIRQEEVGRATAVGYLQVVFAAAWGLLFFSELPDAWTFGGAALILGCTLALAFSRPRIVAAR
ncbi:MAG TPA: DMT family transporter [Longimicrobiaceae bacterium]|nr:DMT family transporter [Longimicrobiaceae bacterium]